MAEPGGTETPVTKIGRLTIGVTQGSQLTPAEKVGQAIRATQERAKKNLGGAEYPQSSGLEQKTPTTLTPEQQRWQELAAKRRGNIAPATARTRIQAAQRETGPSGKA